MRRNAHYTSGSDYFDGCWFKLRRFVMQPANTACLRMLAATLLAAVCSCFGAAQDAPPRHEAAQNLLKRADEIRFPADGYELTVSVRTTSAGQETDLHEY